MKKKLKINIYPVFFTLGGLILGYIYFQKFACNTGCPITSSPFRTMVYMGFVGWLIGSLVKEDKGKKDYKSKKN